MKAMVLLLSLCLSISAHDGKAPKSEVNLAATLWVQTSAEWYALCRQAYNGAYRTLDKALADPAWTAAAEQTGDFAKKPPAIILDVDETVLDNSPFQADMVQRGVPFEPSRWDLWCSQANAAPLPGVIDFLNYAKDKGVGIFYVTNRNCKSLRTDSATPCPQKDDTIKNLRAMGFPSVPDDHFLLKNGQEGWSSEKQSRREVIAQDYRIVMLFGDDLGDFLAGVKKVSTQERHKMVQQKADWFGERWVMLPNPLYGSWQNTLPDPAWPLLRGMD